MFNLRCVIALGMTLALSGCATHYRPLELRNDPGGNYETSVQVDPGGILVYETKITPRTFPVVLILTDSNLYPPRFEFTIRQVLAQLGVTNVFNVEEFRQFAMDQRFDLFGSKFNSDSISRFSAQIAPVMVISASYRYVFQGRVRVTLRVIDGRSNLPLLQVDHPRNVTLDFVGEALLPVFNQLRRWYRDSSGKPI